MFLNQLLEEYKVSDRKQEILEEFLQILWNNKYIFQKYKKYFRYKVNSNLLDNRTDLIELFNKYSEIEYVVCRSYYKKKLDPISYIRIHINNMYGYLFDKDVYYDSRYYKLLLTPKREYFRLVNNKNQHGNLDDVNYDEVKRTLEEALQEAELIKLDSINKKYDMKFSQYKQLINSYIKRIFDNYTSVEEYENKYGWNLDVKVDGWLEDNYVISYFCKSLTGYLKNYIRSIKMPVKKCMICGANIPRRNTYCNSCYKIFRRQYKTNKQRQYRNVDN